MRFRDDYPYIDFVKNILFFDNLLGREIFNLEDALVKMDYPFSKKARFLENKDTLNLSKIYPYFSDMLSKSENAASQLKAGKKSLLFRIIKRSMPKKLKKYIKLKLSSFIK